MARLQVFLLSALFILTSFSGLQQALFSEEEASSLGHPEEVRLVAGNQSHIAWNYTTYDLNIGADIDDLMLVDWWKNPTNRSMYLLTENGDSLRYSPLNNQFALQGDFLFMEVDDNGTLLNEIIIPRRHFYNNLNQIYNAGYQDRYSRGGLESMAVFDHSIIFSGVFQYESVNNQGGHVQQLFDVNFSSGGTTYASAVVFIKVNRTTFLTEDSIIFETSFFGGSYPCKVASVSNSVSNDSSVRFKFRLGHTYRNPNNYCSGIVVNGTTESSMGHSIHFSDFSISIDESFSSINSRTMPRLNYYTSLYDDYVYNTVETFSGIGDDDTHSVVNHEACDAYGNVMRIDNNLTAVACTRPNLQSSSLFSYNHSILLLNVSNSTIWEVSLGERGDSSPATLRMIDGDRLLVMSRCSPNTPCNEYGAISTTDTQMIIDFFSGMNRSIGLTQGIEIIDSAVYSSSLFDDSEVVMHDLWRGPGLIPNINSKGIEFLIGDLDQDSEPDFLDDYPADFTQQRDTDLDGFGDNGSGVLGDDCPEQFGTSHIDKLGCLDSDSDGVSDQGDTFPLNPDQTDDSDSDGYGDNSFGSLGDACPTIYGTSSRNETYGCPDADFDGWADSQDHFPNESSQWKDSDGDGYGDEFNGFEGDDCIITAGTSYVDRFGCLDTDSDGVSDKNDAFPNNPTQTDDRDGDGYGDNQSENATHIDRFPSDTTQWNDTDGDGYGDNQNGNLPDRFPNDPNRWQDSDRDGVADEEDAFPDDATQDTDSDGDGYGDNAAGNRGDTFPNDPDEWDDTDGDDVGNNEDAFPFDPSQTTDADGDGFGDNPRGTGADKFPEDSTQWSDIDGDGYGDNAEGTTPDAFIADPTQWSDIDGDGYGDNPTGRLADAFPNDPTQWEDLDGDGFGDNLSGNNPDPYLFDFDNDGYNDSIDPLPKLASPGDLDNDGVLDENDAFPEDYREWADADGDGEGDNADTDDDNDGWTDTDEVRQGTDPFSSSSQPIDGFEVIIPGTQVSLGAWDLIGIFGGVPVFIWIAIGFATRNGRTARYEEMLRGAQSVEDLEHISGMWEYSLMMRMLGPHQGIRLERLRADLEYEFLGHRRTSTLVDEYDQTEHVEKALPGLEQAVAQEPMETQQPPQSVAVSTNVLTADTAAQRADENGYEWFTMDDGMNFYRTVGSGAEWVKFEN
jgi:hypothetical protein